MIEIINDDLLKKHNNIYRLSINNKKSKEIITINPFRLEHYNDIDLFNLKIYCDKNNIILRVLSTMNYMPVNSQYADELILVENEDHMKRAYESTGHAVSVLGAENFDINSWKGYFEVRFYQIGNNPLNRKCYDNSGIIEKIYDEVTLEELKKFIKEKKVLIRKSSFDLFNQIKLPDNIFIAEIKQTFKKLINCLDNKGIVGLDYEFQKRLLEKTKHHYMAIQVLSSIKLDWKIIAGGGSARLFSMLPTKNILLMARDLFGNDNKIKPKKIGWINKEEFPWTGNQIDPNWQLTKSEIDKILGIT